MKKKEWTPEEHRASVDVYIQMHELQRQGIKFIKEEYYRELQELYGRSSKSIRYRMHNISYVYSLLGQSCISGIKPAKNVGKNVLRVILDLVLENIKEPVTFLPDMDELVSIFRESNNGESPLGNKSPNRQLIKSLYYARDPRVSAWVLDNAQGYCENCHQQAPFQKVDGDSYLEVHHLKMLAEGGSDTINNAIAVCPNCHRELHYGVRREELREKLYSENDRLIPEKLKP